jgi:hypothetical protein
LQAAAVLKTVVAAVLGPEVDLVVQAAREILAGIPLLKGTQEAEAILPPITLAAAVVEQAP